MELFDIISNDLKEAMKAKDKVALDTLRNIKKAVIEAINPNKDVDAFHPVNVGKIMIGDYSFLPCTPAGVMELI